MLGVVVLIMSVLYFVSFYCCVWYNIVVYFTFSSDVAVWSGKVVLSINIRLLVSH